jgi:hypothetical protein
MMKFIKLLKKIRNPKQIYDYFEGNFWYWLNNNYPKLVPTHYKEQFYYRLNTMNKNCLYNSQCVKCGCDIPQLQWCTKQCDASCYPPRMSKRKWIKFKLSVNLDNKTYTQYNG